MSRLRGGVRLRLLSASLATMALTALTTLTTLVWAPTSAAEPADSAVTVQGRGDFAGLKVTVSNTRDLRNEVVQVTWTGAAQTRGNFGINYLQIFQCWGDDPAGPDREQCQYGGLAGDNRGGAQVASRQVTYDIKDPAETYQPTPSRSIRYVPFRSVTGKTTEAGLSEFFDGTTSNEVPFGATRSDGGGFTPFEIQTAVEAPGLGCGEPRLGTAAPAPLTPASASPSAIASPRASSSATPTAAVSATVTASTSPSPSTTASPATARPATDSRQCWLVVVPRNNKEVDGSTRSESSTRQLLSSPLSASNWAQRLVVPLSFAPVGQPCPLGRSERPVVGQENATEAVSSWQPALCAGNGPLFSYSQVPDALARRQAVGDAPGLSLTTRPLAASEVPAGRVPVYAPIALTGLSVAFNIESQSAFSAPPEVKARDGQRLTELQLTPRLVAKLLTQSYRLAAADPDRAGLEKNPQDLTRDPDFLRLNPAFRQLRFVGIEDMLVPAGLADSNALVWQWVLGDAEARAFVNGAPDPDGMVVNPHYKATSQQEGFPKSDPACRTFTTAQRPLCTLDAHPYAADGQEAARAAARGDTLARTTYDAEANPPVYRRSVPQPTGSRALLALTDAATARRFGLQTAKLRNAAGAFVAPDDAALLAGLSAMTASAVPGVVLPDPRARAAEAYPLSTLTYALATPAQLSAQARRDYATFLRYAVGKGQEPGEDNGQLPPGYAPLPGPVRAQTLAAATRIERSVGPAGPASPAGGDPASVLTPPATDVPPRAPFGPTGSSTVIAAPLLAAGPTPPDRSTAPPVVPRPQAAPAPAPIVLVGRTPYDAPGPARYGVVLALGLGALAALMASVLRRRVPPYRAVEGRL